MTGPGDDAPTRRSDATIEAAGRISEAYETLIRARGHLYSFHQLLGTADLTLGDGIDQLRDAGHDELADELSQRWLGRNVLPDRWTFQVVEEFDDTYFELATAAMQRVRDALLGGERHPHEARMKAAEREDGPADDR